MSPYERLAWQALEAHIESEYWSSIWYASAGPDGSRASAEQLLKQILDSANIRYNQLNFWALVQKGNDLIKKYHQ